MVETKEQSKQRRICNEKKKQRLFPQLEKLWRLFFFGIAKEQSSSTMYFEKVKSVTCAHYESLLYRLKTEIHEGRQQLVHRVAPYHHDNAPAYYSAVVLAKLMGFGFQHDRHLSYSTDLDYLDI